MPTANCDTPGSLAKTVLRAVAGIALTTSGAHAVTLTYAVNIQTGVSEFMTGSVTTDGILGVVGAADIISWSFSATGPTPYSISSTDAGAHISFTGAPIISTAVVTPGLLARYLTLDTNLGPGSISFVDGVSSSSSRLVFTVATPPPATMAFFQSGAISPYYLADNIRSPFSFGVSQGAPVPEPATYALFLAGLGGIGVRALRIGRRPPLA